MKQRSFADETYHTARFRKHGSQEGARAQSARGVACLPATFKMLYESHDGRLCLFESAEGHLAAVDASKFA